MNSRGSERPLQLVPVPHLTHCHYGVCDRGANVRTHNNVDRQLRVDPGAGEADDNRRRRRRRLQEHRCQYPDANPGDRILNVPEHGAGGATADDLRGVPHQEEREQKKVKEENRAEHVAADLEPSLLRVVAAGVADVAAGHGGTG